MFNLDDYDFPPVPTSNLGSPPLSFFADEDVFDPGVSLSFTAPKQPRLKSPPAPEQSKADLGVISARIALVWKLDDGKYNSKGKQGVAIIGSDTQSLYEIVVYKDNENVLVKMKIDKGLQVFAINRDFIAFYDNSRNYWLLKFVSDDFSSVTCQLESLGAKVFRVNGANYIPIEPITYNPSDVASQIKDGGAQSFAESGAKSCIKEPPITTNPGPESDAKVEILNRIAKMGQSILPTNVVEDRTSVNSNEIVPTSQMVPSVQTVTAPPPGYAPLSTQFAENRAQSLDISRGIIDISHKLNTVLDLINEKNTPDLNSQVKVLRLQNENLRTELDRALKENASLKASRGNTEYIVQEFNMKLHEKEVETGALNTEIHSLKVELHEILEREADLQAVLQERCNAIKNFEEKIKALDKCDKKEFIVNLKKVMNGLFNNLVESINNESLNSTIASSIKGTTLNIVQIFKESHKTESV